MRDVFRDLYSFIYSLNLGDYFFYAGIILTIILFVYIFYLLKCSEHEEENNNDDILDLLSITEKIENEYKPGKIELTGYEAEQENTAIISYEELVSSKDKFGFKYDDEYISDEPELQVKKIDVGLSGPEPDTKLKVKLMSYDKEEAFLSALKQLHKNLIN